MRMLRILLFPFSVGFGLITWVRNWLYDLRIFSVYQAPIPAITVGNLSVGGTGKTPMLEYLIQMLHQDFLVATLSRGYGRKTKGYLLANPKLTAEDIGDEPFQIFQKFSDIVVAVCENRKVGIQKILHDHPKTQVILLDDAFQHRRVQAGLQIVLTKYNDLFVDDWVLPTGNLREFSFGVNRASIVIVTKCPENLSAEEQASIQKKLSLKPSIPLFFSSIQYSNLVYSQKEKKSLQEIINQPKVVLAGIADPKLFIEKVKGEKDTTLIFPDHHAFTKADIQKIKITANNKPIITTEKDYVRLKNSEIANQLYYLPIEVKIINEFQKLDQIIYQYVGKNS
jgi:tetraacyldisaccharide 4'-kinase